MQVSVLGPVGVRREGRGAELGERMQRLLAALVVSEGSVVSVDRLAEIVWDGDAPDGVSGTLRTYVSRLRRTLDADRDDVLVFRQPGYALDLRPGELDSELFDGELEQAVAHLRTADPEAAVSLLEGALGRWRGDAYALFAEEEWARPEAVRLEERRLEAREALVEARLAAGTVEQAVAEASALVEAAPLRDRPRALLMRGLYVAGRQAEALRVASDYRNFLSSETGLDPSADLVELEGRIARGAPAVDGSVQVLRGYELHERVGEGAFAVVHRATQPGLRRDVAVKIIRGELADRPDFIRRFEVEAQTVARVEHPNVVPLFDFWREPGAAYLVMRLLRGGSVEQALRARGPYSREQTARLLGEVGSALESAHRAGVVHRDVRPANLLLDDEGVTYLADFGIALPTATADDLPIVSPAYAAPEVLRGEPAGAAADVLSLGVTVFELLTGRLPFADSQDRAEVIRRQLNEPLPPVRATRTDLPAAVDDVLARATAKVADDRHGSVAALVDELRHALDGNAATATRLRQAMPTRPVENPYVGLHAFDEHNADRYFGREALVVELVEALEQHPFVTVVGASGSGKSSVVRAGLLPAVRRGAVPGSEDWFVTTMLPGADPVDALETALLRIAVNPPATLRAQLSQPGGMLRAIRRVLPDERARILLVIDQFEELFTHADDSEERDRFLTELAAAVTAMESPVRVVATLRADHYDAPLRHPALAQLVTDGTVTVRPMTADELARAITLPARNVGVEVEAGLVADLGAAVTARPAALPLLQYSLTELFDRRTADVMLHDTHRDLGGLTGAMAARADRIIDAGDAGDEAEARRIFGRLVTLGDGVEDTRRRVLRGELGDGERTAWLVDAFVTARLLATDRDPATRESTLEVAHEALLRDWPRLRAWLDEDRVDLRTLRQVGTYAIGWHAADCANSELARGARLDAAVDLANRHPDWLNINETEWITASAAAAETDAASQAASIERDRRQNRRLRQLLATAVALLIVAAVATAGALVLRNRAVDSERDAQDARDEALTNEEAALRAEAEAEANSLRADRERQTAEQERRAAEEERLRAEARALVASGAAVVDDDPELAVMLALNGAIGLDQDPQAESVLREALGASRTLLYHGPINGPDQAGGRFRGDINPEGSRIVVGSDQGTVTVRDIDNGDILWSRELRSNDEVAAETTAHFVNGGDEVAVGVRYVGVADPQADLPAAGVHVLDAESGETRRTYAGSQCGWRLDDVSTSSDTLVLAYANTPEWEAANVCDMTNPDFSKSGQLHWLDITTGVAEAVGPSYVDSAGFNQAVRIAQADDADRHLIYGPILSTDDGQAATGLRVQRASTGEVVMERPAGDAASVALSSDGSTAVLGGTFGPNNGAIEVIDVETGQTRTVLEGHPGGVVTSVSFVDDDSRLLSIGSNGAVRVWQLDPDRLVTELRTGDAEVRQVARSDDSERLTLFSDNHARVVTLDLADVVDVGVIHACGGAPEFHITSGLAVSGDRVLTRTLCTADITDDWPPTRDEVFDYESRSLTAEFEMHDGQSGALSPNGRYIAHQIQVRVTETSPPMTGAMVVTDIDTGATVTMDGLCAGNLELDVFDRTCGTSPDEPYVAWARDVHFSPDGRLVAMGTGAGGPGRIWDARSGTTLAVWPFVFGAFSPDGAHFVSISFDDQVFEIRETGDFRVVATRPLVPEEEPTNLRFGPNSRTIINTTPTDIYFYDADTFDLIGEPLEQVHEAMIRHVDVSDDGSMFATAGSDGFVRVWSTETWEQLHEIPVDRDDRVQAVAFANDDTHILATTPTGPVRIYTLDQAELLDFARDRVVREFTPNECGRYFPDTPCPTLAEMRSA